MEHDMTMSVNELSETVTDIFLKAGLLPAQASALSRVITAAERDACKSHGIYRIAGCLRTVKARKVAPMAEPILKDDGSGILRIDAQGGFSCAGFEMGAPVLAERAKTLGVAALVINDCVHFSALWPEMEVLTELGVAALAMCPSYASVAPAGGTKALMGTNPIAFGWPRKANPPFVFDFATSVAARGEIELHRRAGTPLPEGWALDPDGHPTTDPDMALDGAMLPFGAHKGSAIAIMIELMAGAMIGDLTSPEARDLVGAMNLAPRHGELVIAFSPERFAAGRPGNPFDRAEGVFDAILGQGARLPSQRRFAARAKATAEGIMLSGAERAELEQLRSLGLDAV